MDSALNISQESLATADDIDVDSERVGLLTHSNALKLFGWYHSEYYSLFPVVLFHIWQNDDPVTAFFPWSLFLSIALLWVSKTGFIILIFIYISVNYFLWNILYR